MEQRRIIRSRRRTLRLEIAADGSLLVRAPYGVPVSYIDSFIASRADWIASAKKRREALNRQLQEAGGIFTEIEKKALKQQAAACVAARLPCLAGQLGVSYGRVSLRFQRSRWGSCSREGNLNFNCLLALAPAEVFDYVMLHELCHRKQMNHSALFYGELKKYCPGYKTCEKWLKTEGALLLRRLGQ